MLNVIRSPTATWRGAAGLFACVKLKVAAEAPIVAAPKASPAATAAAAARVPPRSLPLLTMAVSIAEARGIHKRVGPSRALRLELVALQEALGDDEPLDLVGAFTNDKHRRVAVEPLDLVFL